MNEFIEQMNESGRASYEQIETLGQINVKAMKKIAGIQCELADLGIHSAVEQTRLMSSCANFGELISAQAKLANSVGTRLVEIGRETTEVMAESRDELVNWAQKSFSVASEQAREMGEKAESEARASQRRASGSQAGSSSSSSSRKAA